MGVGKNILGRHWRNRESPTDKLPRGRGWQEEEANSAGVVIMEGLAGQAGALRLHWTVSPGLPPILLGKLAVRPPTGPRAAPLIGL